MFDPIEYINTPRWQTVSLGLDRTRELLARLGNPQQRLRFVHVAGTNGKGSTAAFVASMLQQAGYTVGLFTSPALYAFEDRIRINGKNISPDDLREITLEVKQAADAMDEHPTEFELLTAVAFSYFAQKSCDIAIVEVGLGGRLDSTNIIEFPEVSVITPISNDHCAILGSNVERIAGEKAGIIKSGRPVVCAPQQDRVKPVIKQVADEKGAEIIQVDSSRIGGTNDCFSYRDRGGLTLGLHGAYQLINAATALEAVDVLRGLGWVVPEDAIARGLFQVQWPGRFEAVCKEPLIIFDGGHNEAGVQALVSALEQDHPNHYRILITGVLADKDYKAMARNLVTVADEIITVTPHNPRALNAQDFANCLRLQAELQDRSLVVLAAGSIVSAVQAALERYDALARANATGAEEEKQPLICVCGSLYLLGSVMEVLQLAELA